jgi:hypothetical protein
MGLMMAKDEAPTSEPLQETTAGAIVPSEASTEPLQTSSEAPQEATTDPTAKAQPYTVGTWSGMDNFLCGYPQCEYSTVKGEDEIVWHIHDAHPNWEPK